jgi:replicative DNA helicase
MEADQLPPHDPKAEGLLLACAVHRPSIMLGLSDDLFYLNESKIALAAMLDLKAAGKPSLEFPEQFEHDLMLALPKDIFSHVNSALNDLPSPAGWPYWLSIVAEQAQARKLLSMNVDLDSAAASLARGDKSVLQNINRKLLVISGLGELPGDLSSNMKALDHEAGEQIEEMWTKGDTLIGMPTGFQKLNAFTNGLQVQKFYVVAARPGKGKSSFLAQVALRAATTNNKTLFLSMEMPNSEIYLRLVSIMSRVVLRKFQDRTATQADFENITKARLALRQLPLTICDKELNLSQVISASEKAIKEGVKLIVVDYIQKVGVPLGRENRATVIGFITSALKELAMKHDVVVLAAAQVNRDPEKGGREPVLSDLRESGAIENDADWVAFLHEKDSKTTDLIIRKNRSGPEGKIAFEFRKDIFRFDEL